MLQGANVVMLVTLILWLGLFAYLWSLDGRVKGLRREIEVLGGAQEEENGRGE